MPPHSLTHELGFMDKPDKDGDYPGGSLAVPFLEKILGWVTNRYPEVEFLGMEDFLAQRG